MLTSPKHDAGNLQLRRLIALVVLVPILLAVAFAVKYRPGDDHVYVGRVDRIIRLGPHELGGKLSGTMGLRLSAESPPGLYDLAITEETKFIKMGVDLATPIDGHVLESGKRYRIRGELVGDVLQAAEIEPAD